MVRGLARTFTGLVLGCMLAVVTSTASAQPGLVLSDEEQAWLQRHSVIRLSPDPNFAPVEWFNQHDDYSGVSSDYARLLEQRLGIRFEIVRGKNWKDVLSLVKAGEADALSAIVQTPEREQFLAFSQPYFRLKRAVFSNRSLERINSLDDLKGHKIAVVEGSWMDETLTGKANMSINRFQDLATALIATSLGVTDVTGSAFDTMAFTRRDEGLTNLRLVGELPHDIPLSFAVSRTLAPLAPILDKALASITPAEAAQIRSRWVEIGEPPFWDRPVYRYTALGLLTLLLAGMAVVIIWNRMLNARVRERSQQLQDAQAQLIHAEKMESIGRLSAGVAHEVKNPLAIIQMGADYLSQVMTPGGGVGEVIADIDDAVHRADQVIKGLLDFSHDDELELKPGDINAVVEDSLRLVGHEFRQRDIQVETELAPALPPVAMDANRIQQVLINILMNAAQAMENAGRVRICSGLGENTPNLENYLFPAGESVLRLTIADNGSGISEENLAKLFDPFFTTKPVGAGTGLGLSVSRNIIELHGGKLDICNAPGGGAQVTIEFRLEAGEKL